MHGKSGGQSTVNNSECARASQSIFKCTEIGPDAYKVGPGAYLYKAARVCSAPTHMGVCCVEIGDEMVPLKRERERKTLVTVAVYPLAYTRDHLYHLKR